LGGGSLNTNSPVKTVGSFWPYSTTIFDYVKRAMPHQAPQSLTDDQVYAATAYILYLNKIISKDAVMDAKTLPLVKMPNRDGFIRIER
jgi:cytochrome c